MFFGWMCSAMLLPSSEWIEINVHIHRFSQSQENILYPFCGNKTENEIDLLFHWPTYTPLRCRYMPDSINENENQKYSVCIMNDKLQENILNLAKFLFYVCKLRLSKLSMASLS